MDKKPLFENDSDSEDNININYNENYAKSFNKLKQKELVKKLKEQDSDSSSDSDESDLTDAERTVDPKFDKEFFKTLASLKSKDPKIYDKSTKFFEDLENEEDENKNHKVKSSKPFTLKDYERQIILERNGKFEDEDEENEHKRPLSPSYIEEQSKLKAEIKKILNESDDDNEEFGSIFKKRVASKEEKNKEEEEYVKWLAGEQNDIEEATKQNLKPLKQFWNDPKLPNNEKFLRDYVLNKGYVDTAVHNIPTYEEIIGDSNLSEDEKELEKQAEFEHKYNFRFEEPDQEFIKRYPRTIDNSIRTTDDSRKKKRKEDKERKLKEKAEKMRELEMLKEIKRQEIEEKIQKLKEVTGNDDLPLREEELNSEFDPDAHDRRMQEIFNEEYYKVDEGEDKPDCPDYEELKIEDWDNFDPSKDIENEDNYDLNYEDKDFNMDCDYDPTSKEKLKNEMIESTRDRRKRRRRNRFMEMIKTKKPAFDPHDEKTYAEYIEEYYKMDCEDFIGDIPCRFKYVECEPNDFGLSIEEILMAKNKELNQWASLKKAVQIRPPHVDKRERRLYQMKAKNETLKRKIFTSFYGEQSDEEQDKDLKSDINIIAKLNTNVEKEKSDENLTAEPKTIKKKKKKKLQFDNNQASDIQNLTEKNEKSQKPSSNNQVKKRQKQVENEEQQTKSDEIQHPKKKKSNKSKLDGNQEIYNSEFIKNKKNISKKESSSKNEKKTNKSNAVINNSETTKDVGFSKNNNYVSNSKTAKNNKINSKLETSISKKSKNIKKEFNHIKKNENKTISDERLKAYGLNPRKYNKKLKFLKNSNHKTLPKKQKGENSTKKRNPFS